MRSRVFVALAVVVCALVTERKAVAQEFDVVLHGGRVMDPETGLDGIRDVGIRGRKITAISASPLAGPNVIDVTGLVVSPGFIDLHAHGQAAESRRYQAQDGVTTALELEVGVYPVASWYEMQEGMSLINYGATVGHMGSRMHVKLGIEIGHSPTAPPELRAKTSDSRWAYEPATSEEMTSLERHIEEGIQEGALGVGFGIAYTPGASREEIYRLFKVAARFNAPCYVHVRKMGFPKIDTLVPIQEVLANAAATGAPLHIVHVNSISGSQAKNFVAMIRGAREAGLDVTMESYPYIAGSTSIQAALFDDLGTDRTKLKYEDIMWVDTGERLTKETFEKYKQQGGWVVIFGQDPELVAWLVNQPDVILASDGMPFVNGVAHPRGAGTFSRVLGRYVREQGTLSLMDALKKMTFLPAERVAGIAPAMKKKGRIQIGADADITVFSAENVIDNATFEKPGQNSSGIEHVLVNGIFVVKGGAPVEGVAPGRPVVNGLVASP